MSDLVQGVKLKFELPFKLPAPVSFPFESIGDFRPITRIPKYNYALEKKIMKDIAKQKQEDQFTMLRQAQQQLSMVDLIASRKTRHKGKELDRRSMAAAVVGGMGGLRKPASESGAGRPTSSSSTGAATAAASAEPERPRSQQHERPVAGTDAGAVAATSALGKATAVPVQSVPAEPSQKAARPQSTGAGLPATHSQGTAAPNLPAMSMATGVQAQPIGSHTPNITPLLGRQQPQPQQQPHLHGMYGPASQNAYLLPRPANIPFALGPQHRVSMQPATTAAPQSQGLSVVGPHAGLGYSGMAGPLRPLPSPQLQHIQQPQLQAVQQQPPPRPVPHNPRFSTSFGMGPGATGASQIVAEAAAMRPALPPKPDEWKPQASGPVSVPATTVPRAQAQSQHEQAPPIPPRRTRPPQEPAPPAIPPKPFEAFSEFDYAAGAPGSMGTADSGGHVEQLNLLLGMGFSRPQAIQALEMYDYDVNQASNYLIDRAS